MHLTLCALLYALLSMHFTLLHFTLCASLDSMLFTLCTSLCALHSMRFTLCTSLYALHSMHFSLCCWVRGLRTEEPFAMLSGKSVSIILLRTSPPSLSRDTLGWALQGDSEALHGHSGDTLVGTPGRLWGWAPQGDSGAGHSGENLRLGTPGMSEE